MGILRVLLAFAVIGTLSLLRLIDAFHRHPHCEMGLAFTKPFLCRKAPQRVGLHYAQSAILLKAAVPMPTLTMTFPANRLTTIAQSSLSAVSQASLIWKTFFSFAIILMARMSKRVKRKMDSAAAAMEMGWKQRGYGGGFRRTIEVWIFVISFLFKYVSSLFCWRLRI